MFFDLCLFGFVGFLFLLVFGKGCGCDCDIPWAFLLSFLTQLHFYYLLYQSCWIRLKKSTKLLFSFILQYRESLGTKSCQAQPKFYQPHIEFINKDILLTNQYRRPTGNLYRLLDKSVSLFIQKSRYYICRAKTYPASILRKSTMTVRYRFT